MHRIGNSRGLARGVIAASMLALVAAAFVALRPDATAQAGGAPPKGAPQGKEPQGGGPGGKEEHGGDIVFQVVSKTQKFSVLYSHEKHLGAGCKCDDCHNEDAKKRIFEKKMGANKFRMKDVNEGKFCGTCHQVKPPADVTHGAFAPKGNCTKCHNVRVREEK
jgi:c(7)-type cytochrome triheme protein